MSTFVTGTMETVVANIPTGDPTGTLAYKILVLLGSLSIGNLVSSFTVDPIGNIALTTPNGVVEVGVTGSVKFTNLAGGSLEINPVGVIVHNNGVLPVCTQQVCLYTGAPLFTSPKVLA